MQLDGEGAGLSLISSRRALLPIVVGEDVTEALAALDGEGVDSEGRDGRGADNVIGGSVPSCASRGEEERWRRASGPPLARALVSRQTRPALTRMA